MASVNISNSKGFACLYRIAKAIVVLAKTESADPRPESCKLNINKAVDKAYETMGLSEILKAPPSALQGLTEEHDAMLQNLQIRTIQDLGTCKWAQWSEAIVELSQFDSDSS